MYKAWWGNKPSMVKGDISNVAGVNSFNAIHPVSLVSQLSRAYQLCLDDYLTLDSCDHRSEKTFCQPASKDLYRSRSRYPKSRIGARVPQIRRCSRCHLYCPDEYDICFCGNGIRTNGRPGTFRNGEYLPPEPRPTITARGLARRTSCRRSCKTRKDARFWRLVISLLVQ